VGGGLESLHFGKKRTSSVSAATRKRKKGSMSSKAADESGENRVLRNKRNKGRFEDIKGERLYLHSIKVENVSKTYLLPHGRYRLVSASSVHIAHNGRWGGELKKTLLNYFGRARTKNKF